MLGNHIGIALELVKRGAHIDEEFSPNSLFLQSLKDAEENEKGDCWGSVAGDPIYIQMLISNYSECVNNELNFDSNGYQHSELTDGAYLCSSFQFTSEIAQVDCMNTNSNNNSNYHATNLDNSICCCKIDKINSDNDENKLEDSSNNYDSYSVRYENEYKNEEEEEDDDNGFDYEDWRSVSSCDDSSSSSSTNPLLLNPLSSGDPSPNKVSSCREKIKALFMLGSALRRQQLFHAFSQWEKTIDNEVNPGSHSKRQELIQSYFQKNEV